MDTSALAGALTSWVLITGTLWLLFSRAEDVASAEFKLAMSRWLRNLEPGQILSNWAQGFAYIFDRVFTERHLSWRCFLASCVASSASVAALIGLWVFLRPAELKSFLSDPHFLGHIFSAVFMTGMLNFIPDFLSLLETRYLIRKMARTNSPRTAILLLTLDLLATATIAVSAFAGFLLVLPLVDTRQGLPEFLWNQFWNHGLFLSAHNYRGVPLGVWFYSAFFTSVWLWLFGLSIAMVRLSQYVGVGFAQVQRRLDIDGKPLRSLAFFCIALVTLAYVMYIACLLATALLAKMS